MHLQIWERDELEDTIRDLINDGEFKYHAADRYMWILVPELISNVMTNQIANYLNVIEILEEIANAHFVQELNGVGDAFHKHLLFRKNFYLAVSD